MISKLKARGHDVYDFGDPPAGAEEFGIIPPTLPDGHYTALRSHIGQATFWRDSKALQAAEGVVLVLPCGRSAHVEAGFAAGAGKPLAIYLEPQVAQEPEVMYNFGTLVWNDGMLDAWLAQVAREKSTQRPVHNLARAYADLFNLGTTPTALMR